MVFSPFSPATIVLDHGFIRCSPIHSYSLVDLRSEDHDGPVAHREYYYYHYYHLHHNREGRSRTRNRGENQDNQKPSP